METFREMKRHYLRIQICLLYQMKKPQMNLLKDALGKYEIGCIENFIREKTKEVWWHVIKILSIR